MRSSSLCVFVLSLLVAGCSASEPAAPAAVPAPAPPAPDDTPTTPDAPAEPCADGSYRVSSGACETYPDLAVTRSSTVIAPRRDHHTTMVIETTSGPWLYVIGGTDSWNTLHSDVQRARIAADGSLSTFEEAGKLPEPRAGHCMVKKGERLFLFGGVVGGPRSGPSKTSVVLSLDAEGQVTGSTPGPELPEAVMHLTCDLAGDAIYAAGGRGERSKSTTLSARTRLGVDGVASPFEKMTPLAPDRSHHAALVKDGRLYLIGGITGDPAGTSVNRKDVVFATIHEDGALGEWTAAGTLPAALSVSSAQLYKDAVYIFGGLENGATFSKKIRRATFEEGGVLGSFMTISATLPDPRGHVHQTPMHGAFIYSVGGKDITETSLDAIDVGRFE